MRRKKDLNLLSIEFASSRVKLAKVRRVGHLMSLLDARSVQIPRELDDRALKQVRREAARQLLEGENKRESMVLVSLNSEHTSFFSYVLPKIPSGELVETLKWKLKEDISFPVEDAILSYRMPHALKSSQEQNMPTLVSAIPRFEIDPFMEMITALGFEQVSSAQSVFSINHFLKSFPGAQGKLIAIVDIGDKITDVSFYSAGQLVLLRKLSLGGRLVTQALTQPLVSSQGTVSLSSVEAEQIKSNEPLVLASEEKLIFGKIERSKLSAAIRPEIERLTSELKRSVDYYSESHGELVEEVFVTGGMSKMPGLSSFFEEELKLPVRKINLKPDLQLLGSTSHIDIDVFYRPISAAIDFDEAQMTERTKNVWQEGEWVKRVSEAPVLVGLFAALLFLCGLLHFRYQSILEATADLEMQVSNLAPGYKIASDLYELERSVLRGKKLEDAILKDEPLWNEIFRELSGVVPNEVTLKSVKYGTDGIFITGETESGSRNTLITDMIRSMEGSIFQNVNLVRTEKKDNAVAFVIRLELASR
jgi:type IV pilus assembly protein PilM